MPNVALGWSLPAGVHRPPGEEEDEPACCTLCEKECTDQDACDSCAELAAYKVALATEQQAADEAYSRVAEPDMTLAEACLGYRVAECCFAACVARFGEGSQEEGSPEMAVRMIQRKENNVGKIRQHGYRLLFRTEEPDDRVVGVSIKSLDLATIPEFAVKLTWKQRTEAALAHGALSLREYMDQVGEDYEDKAARAKASTALSRAKTSGYVTQTSDGRWGLTQRG